jgi:hypothetical protein
MPRNGTRDTPKDLMAALAARKDGVTRVRAYIPGIAGARPAPRASCPASCPARVLPCAPEGPARALRGRSSRRAAGGLTAALIPPCCAWPAEPVAAFRVHADGGLKQRMEEWRGPNHYTSGLRNLLQRHFKKVTTGEWFSSGAVLVHTPVANSVERTWGRGARQPHPKWDNVTWEEVSSSPRPDPPPPHPLLVPPVKPALGHAHTRPCCAVAPPQVYMPAQPSAGEAAGTLTNPPAAAADSHDDETPADQPTLPQSQSEPAAAQNQIAVHQQLPGAQTEHPPPLAPVKAQPEQPGRAPAASGSVQARSRGDTECGSAGARDSCQPSARSVDVDKGAGWGVEGGASGSGGAPSASTAAVSAGTSWSPPGAGHTPVDDAANAAVASEMSAESSAATGPPDSETLSGRKRCHATLVAENP